MSERQLIQPIDADEIKSGIVTKVCEALYEAMNKTCNLYGCAYPKFKAEGEIRLTLDNFGEVRLDAVNFAAESDGEFHNPVTVSASIDIPYTPPNLFRKQTGQGIPTVVTGDDGSIEQKAVFFKQERKLGRADRETDI